MTDVELYIKYELWKFVTFYTFYLQNCLETLIKIAK